MSDALDTSAEVLRLREHMHRLTDRVQSALISHAEVATLVHGQADSLENIAEMLTTLQTSVNALTGSVQQFGDRQQLLERVVFGACAIVLAVFVTALAAGRVGAR